MTRAEIKDLIRQAYTKASDTATPPPTPQEEKPSANVLKFPIVARFPEIDKVLVQLMTDQYGVFIKDVEWVAPKPTTFRIKLANNQYFYLTYSDKSWTAQVEGKKYYDKFTKNEIILQLGKGSGKDFHKKLKITK